MLRSLLLASLLAYGSAQSLSAQCTTTLLNVAANPDVANCLSPGSLSPLITNPNASIVAPINSWVTTMCAAQPCSNDTLAAVVTNITSGCQTELSGTGLSADNAGSIIPIVQTFYPTVRQIFCLKDGNTNCITQTLTNIEAADGTLTLSKAESLLASPSALPSSVTCTNCVKAAYNIVNQSAPSFVSDVSSALQSQCGASFVDGSAPSGIVQSASTSGAAAASGSGALPAFLLSGGALAGLGTSGVIVISTIFSFLA